MCMRVKKSGLVSPDDALNAWVNVQPTHHISEAAPF